MIFYFEGKNCGKLHWRVKIIAFFGEEKTFFFDKTEMIKIPWKIVQIIFFNFIRVHRFFKWAFQAWMLIWAVVSVLTLYYDDPSSNPSYLVYNSVKLFEKDKNKRKRGREWPFKTEKIIWTIFGGRFRFRFRFCWSFFSSPKNAIILNCTTSIQRDVHPLIMMT